MLAPRLIPVLLVYKGGLVKSIRFGDYKYLGDPLNAVRLFNEKGVDELVVLDIEASALHKQPDYNLISRLAEVCRMPLCYGGGVSTPEQIKKIVSLGVEKVAISSSALANPSLITTAARLVGSQSIVGVIDVKRVGLLKNRYEVFTLNGTKSTKLDPIAAVCLLQDAGAGEILVNSIDRDGTMSGYDDSLVASLAPYKTTPVTFLGGVGDFTHFTDVLSRHGLLGLAAGSYFVFKGKHRAVLIQYPPTPLKDSLASYVSH